MSARKAIAAHPDPAAGVVILAYAAARAIWPGIDIGEDALLVVISLAVGLRALWERRKRLKGREVLDTIIDVATAVRDSLPPDPPEEE